MTRAVLAWVQTVSSPILIYRKIHCSAEKKRNPINPQHKSCIYACIVSVFTIYENHCSLFTGAHRVHFTPRENQKYRLKLLFNKRINDRNSFNKSFFINRSCQDHVATTAMNYICFVVRCLSALDCVHTHLSLHFLTTIQAFNTFTLIFY